MTSKVLVRCVVHDTDLDCEEGTVCNFFVTRPLNVLSLASNFPYEGDFHFRYKMNREYLDKDCEFDTVWMDIVNEEEEIPMHRVSSNNNVFTVDIQAVCLSLPLRDGCVFDDFLDDSVAKSEGQFDYIQYLQVLTENRYFQEQSRPTRRSIDPKLLKSNDLSSILDSMSINDLGKGMKKMFKKTSSGIAHLSSKTASNVVNIWDTVSSGVTNIFTGGGSSVLSDDSINHLSDLSEYLDNKYNDQISLDRQLLEKLWNVTLGSKEQNNAHGVYKRINDQWKQMGWQRNDPVQDLKATGTLSLRCMVYLGTNYKTRTQEMLRANRANVKTNYPFAIVGINMTLLLSDVLKLSKSAFLSERANYWELFEDADAFYEIFSFCFMYMDTIWRSRGATRPDFGKLTFELKESVTKVLKRGPKSVNEFKMIAVDENMIT